MPINELIARGIDPIGRDLPQIWEMLNKKKQDEAAQQMQNESFAMRKDEYQQNKTKDSLLQNALAANDRSTVMHLDPDLAMKMDQSAGEFAKNGIETLMSVKDNPEQFQQVAQSLAADDRAKWLGVDISHITPDSVAQLAAKTGVGLPQQPQPTGMAAEMALRNKDPSGYDAFLTNKERIGHMFDKPASKDAPAPSYRDIIDPTNPKQLITVDGRLYHGGGLGSPGVLGVGAKEPSAAKADETRGTGAQAVNEQISNLRDLYGQLDRGGGITNTNAGVLTNAGNYVQSSGGGQFVGRVFGTENQSLRNSIKQARPLLLQSIRQATGMTAKQMDSNVELQLYLSAATDPQLDIQANRRALDNLENLIGSGKLGSNDNQAATKQPAGKVLRFDAQGNPL